ncbi:undecaprenyl-diphosphate phosphatase, partial [Gordonibacter urolithinfaciens]
RHARQPYGDVADEAEAQLFKITNVDEIDWKTALKIGCFQVLAIIPGTSRSGATIIGGMLSGCSRTAAAEFTFFLAIPIMFGWGLVKCLKFFAAGLAMTMTEVVVLAVGIVTAFVMSVIAIKFLMGYIKKNDFTVFGWYRIVVGVLVLGYFVFESMGMLP